MIASEALKDREMTKDKGRIDRLATIIYDENVRLGNHIERVLHIAKLDKEDFKLEEKTIEVNDLLSAVVDSMSLQLQKIDAKVTLSLDAQADQVIGDELHLSNVIFNLLDNAIKYCENQPRIEVNTYNSGKNIVIRIKDNGIGMSRDQQSKIFDQFYRIPTGNLHNVKGFGLGLSYVNNIIKRLKGQIRVKSEKGIGSEFEILLPLL
jgi:two-component system phosphate regulon sensor histidine kinase PhoR